MQDYELPGPDMQYYELWILDYQRTQKIIIQDGITSIGDYAFYGFSALTSVELPDSITRIGRHAFERCTALPGIDFPSGLTSIRSSAFQGCTSLTSITLPPSLKYIGTTAFAECGLTNVKPAGSGKTWDFFYAESGGDPLYHIALPASVTTVEYCAFAGNPLPHDPPDFAVPSALTAIEAEAFAGTPARFVWLSYDMQTIASGAFAGCTGLRYIFVPYSVHSIAADAIPKTAVILGFEGSFAQTFAESNGYTFIPLESMHGGNG